MVYASTGGDCGAGSDMENTVKKDVKGGAMARKEPEVLPKEEVNEYAVITTVPGFLDCATIISQLRAKYAGKSYDVSTTQGMAEAVAARRELREARIALDKKKPDVKKEALDFCKAVEDEYKTIRAAVVEYEDIPDAAIKAEDERKERIKAEEAAKEEARRGAILEQLQRMASIPVSAVPMSAAETMALLEQTRLIPLIAEEMQEFLSKAQSVKATCINSLIEMHAAKVQAEGEAARLAEEREQQEQERREREAEELIERAKREKEQKEAAAKLAAEREAFEAEQAEARKAAEEKEAARQQAWKEAEAEREATAAKLAADRAELERRQAELADVERKRLAAFEEEQRQAEQKAAEESARIKAAERRKAEDEAIKEQARQAKANEKAAEEMAKKLADPLEALSAIHALCVDAPVKTVVIVRIEAISKKFAEVPCQPLLKAQ